MVPLGYLVAAGALAGVAALRTVLISYLVVWADGVTAVAGYTLAAAWVAFLLVPVTAAGIGHAGGRATDGPPELVRSGAVCFGTGLLAGAIAVGVALAGDPSSGSPREPLFRAASFALTLLRAATVAAVAVVAGAAVAAE